MIFKAIKKNGQYYFEDAERWTDCIANASFYSIDATYCDQQAEELNGEVVRVRIEEIPAPPIVHITDPCNMWQP